MQRLDIWTLNKAMEEKIDAFEMYIYRRMLKISWTQKITNVEVLLRMGTGMVKERKTGYLGHIMKSQRYKLVRLVLEEKVRRSRSHDRIPG